ncbi:MAG: hypothetical protein ACRC9L_02260 [Brevinema sp.]
MLDLFIKGAFLDHIALSKGLGLALFLFLPYQLEESLLTSLRFTLFLLLMCLIGWPLRIFFASNVYFSLLMVGVLGVLMAVLNTFLPNTKLGDSIIDIVKRGDPLVFLAFTAAMGYQLSYSETMVLALGQAVGASTLLIVMISFIEYFHLHRFGLVRAAAWRTLVLAVLAFLVA